MINLIWSGLVMVVLLSGCGWDGSASRKNTFTPLTSITITADYSTIAQGTSVKLKALGNFSGYFSRDISNEVTWTSDTPAVASFVTAATPNRLTGQAPGNAVLTATMKGVSATFKMTVSSATATFLNISSSASTVPAGTPVQYKTTGTFSDGTTQVITFDAAWTSSDTTVATVGYSDDVDKEVATTLAAGTTTITATFGGHSDSQSLTVTAPVVKSIAVATPNSITTVLSLSKQTFTAKGTYTDGTIKDITSQVAWGSSNTNVAPVPDSTGVTTTVAQGTTNISASLNGVSGTTTLTVAGGTLSNFTPLTDMTVVKGTSIPISITGTFGTGASRDITSALDWTFSNPGIASVTKVAGNRVLINALATGSTTITATSPGPTGVSLYSYATLTVKAPAFSNSKGSFTVSTTSLNLTAGTSTRFTTTANFNDGTSQDVTANVVLTPDDTTIASVSTAGAVGQGGIPIIVGQVSGTTITTTTINGKFTYNGQPFDFLTPITVTVTQRTLRSIAISPSASPQSLTSGSPTKFTVTATYSDGTSLDVTADAALTIDDGNIAILADSQNQPGQVIGVGSGTTTLTATFGGLDKLTVTLKVP